MENSEGPLAYQQELVTYLRRLGYSLDERPFLPHVTVARAPFEEQEWCTTFHKMPVITHHLHLFESVGDLVYKPLWTHQIPPPFEEISHTADVAFRVYGTSMRQLGVHAQIALCFKCPQLLDYLLAVPEDITLDDLIIDLNDSISRADSGFGCPLKAVSFHGEVVQTSEGLYTWEMVIDV